MTTYSENAFDILLVRVYISYVAVQISDSNALQMSGFAGEMENK